MADLRVVLVFVLASACVAPETYPDQYARTWCEALYSCVNEADTLTWTGWHSKPECVAEVQQEVRSGGDYRGWETGECNFSADAAASCLDKVHRIRTFVRCDGEMPIYEFWEEANQGQCDVVYECAL